MAERNTGENTEAGCCKVVAIVTVDERGQMVLPKEIREKARIGAGDKLAAISCEKDGEVCCISLLKVDNLSQLVKEILGPAMSDIIEVRKREDV
jgi:AbrB family looped-hinge helix DNA binding protein